MTAEQKAAKLREAMELLETADALIQQVFGPTDRCYEYHNTIANLVDDLNEEVEVLA